ncbi:MAG: family 43 glycosylhydrolase [Clostridia bacterium]|nr:family 43 glycosylhydrolase [Clostridia bacterium]
MFKKFLAFFLATIVLFGAVGMMYFKFIAQTSYPVFIESFPHGMLTVDRGDTNGEDSKFYINCKKGQTLTININPERTENKYYNLSKLTVNGIDVTDEVNMLQYRVKVDSKLTILAYFKKGKRPSSEEEIKKLSYDHEPIIEYPAESEYIGSDDAYDFSDPSIIFDEKSGYYYCFGSKNKVMRSKDLLNWEHRTTYFPSPSGESGNTAMSLDTFPSVRKWAKAHGYNSGKSLTASTNNAEPLAPDIIKIGSTYFLYFSLCKEENSSEAAIFCVKTTDLEYAVDNNDWQDGGLVISSCGYNKGSNNEKPNKSFYEEAVAVHPGVFEDENGNLFMTYGSYCGKDKINGSINLVELNSKNGLLKKDSAYNQNGSDISTVHGETRFKSGTLVSKPGSIPALDKNQGSLVTAADIVFNKNTGYYYLFVTYGNEQTNYNIRVARSKSVGGPYEDWNGENMSEFSSSKRNNQYTKGLSLIGGYNFAMSSNGGVSYVDVGKASTGSPCIIKIAGGQWIMALQSRLYYKAENNIYAGDKAAELYDVSANTAPFLEIRQIFFNSDGWPLAVAESYTGESAKRKIKESKMNGNWDVVVLERSASETDHLAIERSVSQPLTIIDSVAISRNNIDKKTRLSKLKFEKADDYSYNLLLDGVIYKIYPTIAWDWELSEPAYIFSGIGDDGTTVWGKKNYSPYMGIYTDAYYYALSQADDETQQVYNARMSEISANPSQVAIDEMTKELVKKVLEK